MLWIDLEHGALSARDAQVLALAVQSTGAQAFVRVPSSRSDVLAAVLDAGVDGVVVPSVGSADEAREATRRLSYPPAGVRGFGPRRAGSFGRAPDFASSAEARPSCVVQIETPAGPRARRGDRRGARRRLPGARLRRPRGVARHRPPARRSRARRGGRGGGRRGRARPGVAFGIAGTGPARQLASLAAGRADVVLVSADVRLYAAGVDAQADALRRAFEAVRAPA